MIRPANAHVVDKVFRHAVLTSANLAEAVHHAIHRGYRRPARELCYDLAALGLRTVPVTDADAVRTGELLHESARLRDRVGGRSFALSDAACPRSPATTSGSSSNTSFASRRCCSADPRHAAGLPERRGPRHGQGKCRRPRRRAFGPQ
ncbi:hypothetical protein OG216_45635 [Streptomycetaceae bacterium NBC_01309]